MAMAVVILILLALVLVFGPGLWVRRVLARYSLPADRYSGSGAQLARHLLDAHGLSSVKVETTETGDHYDPEAKAVRLTPDKFDGRSLTAITVAAHEVGHALQDHQEYAPLRFRTRLVKAPTPFSNAARQGDARHGTYWGRCAYDLAVSRHRDPGPGDRTADLRRRVPDPGYFGPRPLRDPADGI